MLTPEDHDRIIAAVGKAEAATSGEILCVLAKQVSNYREVPLAWAAAAALLAPPIGLALGLHPLMVSQVAGGWVAANTAALDSSLRLALTGYGLIQVLVFAVVAVLIASVTPLKLALTPTVLKRRRVHQAAMHQLMATRLLGSGMGAAVVIFASQGERMVAVVGDEAIHVKAGDPVWKAAVDAVLQGVKSGDPASGFVRAIEICGAVLAEHFPAEGRSHNALSDRLVEL